MKYILLYSIATIKIETDLYECILHLYDIIKLKFDFEILLINVYLLIT